MCPPPQLSGCISFAPSDARAIFLIKDLLCYGTCSATSGWVGGGGGGGTGVTNWLLASLWTISIQTGPKLGTDPGLFATHKHPLEPIKSEALFQYLIGETVCCSVISIYYRKFFSGLCIDYQLAVPKANLGNLVQTEGLVVVCLLKNHY